MSRRAASLKGLVIAGCLSLAAGGTQAADQSLPETVIGAFDTVVTDAKTLAGKAAAAAEKAAATRKKPKSAKTGSAPKEAPGAGKAPENGPDANEETDGKPPRAAERARGDQSDPASTNPKRDAATAGGTPPASDAAKKDSMPEKGTAGEQKTGDTAKDAAPAKKPSELTEWPAADIELAKARCTQLLKGLNIVAVPEAPIRQGECGTPAPVRVIAIGKTPEVSFSPPAVMTCDLAATLVKWIEKDVQPAARKILGSEVIRVESMSDYSCRHAYGRIGNKLSEHGKVNALDIRGFVTARGKTAYVLEGWGLNQRDARRIAEAKAAAAAAAKEKTAAAAAKEKTAAAAKETGGTKQGQSGTADAEAQATAKPAAMARTTIVEGLPKSGARKPSLELPASASARLEKSDGARLTSTALESAKAADGEKAGLRKRQGKSEPARSGEKVSSLPGAEIEVAPPAPTTATSRFLHEVHDDACRTFGTTLGPEANEAHRNHFHVDMAERKYKKICD